MNDETTKGKIMNIIEKHIYRSATLQGAPARSTLAEAEADELRGVEVEAFLRLLPGLTVEQWQSAVAVRDAARYAARYAARVAAWDAVRDAAWVAARDAARALVVRDLITAEQFDILTAPMRAVGIDFDNLGGPQ